MNPETPTATAGALPSTETTARTDTTVSTFEIGREPQTDTCDCEWPDVIDGTELIGYEDDGRPILERVTHCTNCQ